MIAGIAEDVTGVREPLGTGNPLLEPLGPFPSLEELALRLEHWPLAGVDVSRMPLHERELFLTRMDQVFEPGVDSLEIAYNILKAVYSGYLDRDPTIRDNRLALDHAVSGLRRGLSPALRWQAHGVRVQGITGLGKSAVVKRLLSLLPQRIVHGPESAFHQPRQTQLTWIYVDMSHDGSRSGLLYAIAAAIDAALGTEHRKELSKGGMTIDRLISEIYCLLSLYYVGILVIDEVQALTLADPSSPVVLGNFFLRLMNLGIPVVLAGNPLGFRLFAGKSQLIRRLTSGGDTHLYPAPAWDDADWADGFVARMLDFNVLRAPCNRTPELLRDVYRCSGGIRDFARQLLQGAQTLALREGAPRLERDHLAAAYRSSLFDDRRNLIRGFVERRVDLLAGEIDVPWEEYGARWDAAHQPSTTCAAEPRDPPTARIETPSTVTTSAMSKVQRVRQLAKATATRRQRHAERAARLKKTLAAEDIRSGGLTQVLLNGFDGMLSDMSLSTPGDKAAPTRRPGEQESLVGARGRSMDPADEDEGL